MKHRIRRRLLGAFVIGICLVLLTSCGEVLGEALELLLTEETEAADPFSLITDAPDSAAQTETSSAGTQTLDENGSYSSKEDVALYLWTYHRLPKNFITKEAAQALGWPGGSLEAYAPGCAIGGDYFGNYDGLLPAKKKYRECDIGTVGKSSRGAKRIVYAEDFSAIYYTDDHYESFTLLYGSK